MIDMERLRVLEKDIEATDRLVAKSRKLDPDIMYGRIFIKHRDTILSLIAELGQEVGAVESFRGSLNSWIMAYPEQCFSEPQPEELFWLRDAKPGLLDRISASMGRHVAKCLITDFDAAFANFTSPAHTSEARDALRNLVNTVHTVAFSGDYGIHDDAIAALSDALDDANAAMRQEGGGDE